MPGEKVICDTWVFAKLPGRSNPVRINDQMSAMVKRHADSRVKLALWLEPLSDIHFNADIIENPIRTSSYAYPIQPNGNALFILILAVINFINFSTRNPPSCQRSGRSKSIRQQQNEPGLSVFNGNLRAYLCFRTAGSFISNAGSFPVPVVYSGWSSLPFPGTLYCIFFNNCYPCNSRIGRAVSRKSVICLPACP